MSNPSKSTLKAVKDFAEANRAFVRVEMAVQFEQEPSRPVTFLDFEDEGIFWASSLDSKPCGERVTEVVRIYDDEDEWEHFLVKLDAQTPITLVFEGVTSPEAAKDYDAAKEKFAKRPVEIWAEQLENMKRLVRERPPWPERDTVYWGTGVWSYFFGRENKAVAIFGEGMTGLRFQEMDPKYYDDVVDLTQWYSGIEPSTGDRVREIIEMICEKKGAGLWFDDPIEIVASDEADALAQLFMIYKNEVGS